MEEEEEMRGCDAVDHKIEAMLIHNNGRTSSFGPAKVNAYGQDRKSDKQPKENYPLGTMNITMSWAHL